MFITCGILFNHESPRRGENFVTRKITRGVASIKLGTMEFITLGNLDSCRDWGHAKDYVEAMWLMLQHDTPDDFVIATGSTMKVRDFAVKCFEYIGLQISWKGKGLDEIGVDQNGVTRIKINSKYFRAKEVNYLLGDPTKAKNQLHWIPKTTLEDLIKEMIETDLHTFQSHPEY
ncbi:GDP-mannose 4,6 dehydratase 2 [Thelohanellus kitauei]|uniref:GDP-mannose 4,6-dehydratase n=1 Tax=Thelohanellus kitauei TaxID=669202 RepID=A0A0C2ME25_THEKT|nr:GDP-mannose 4,6 dehydratase 2 [Thelohanellus kitauei]